MISIISLLVRHKGIGHINWIQDLFPEIAIELGFKMFRGPVGLLAKTLRNASLRRATINVAIGEAMADRLANLGVERDRIHIISNWSNDAVIHPILPADNALRREWSLSNKFVVGYSGNLGIPHETETLIGSAVRLRERDDICFLFVGGGHNMEAVKARARVLHLDNFVFKPYQSREILGETLSVPDLHWLSLRPELEGLILPSKLYGIAAAGRPVLAIAALDGEIAKLVIDHKCGFAIEPGASEELAAAITNLADNPERCQAMGQNARRMLDQNFTRESAMSAWERTLNAARQAIAQTSSVPLVATALTSGRRLSERNFDALRPVTNHDDRRARRMNKG
jgi:glycosyltransferase involved in cell wall biosynthesis